MVIPLNLLFWYCESWALTKASFKKIEVSHMRCLRRILKIKWCDVMENKISNLLILKYFNNSRTIESQIVKRWLTFVGEIMRLPSLKIPSRLISTYCSSKRPVGRPNYTVRHSMLNHIKKIIPKVDKSGSFHT